MNKTVAHRTTFTPSSPLAPANACITITKSIDSLLKDHTDAPLQALRPPQCLQIREHTPLQGAVQILGIVPGNAGASPAIRVAVQRSPKTHPHCGPHPASPPTCPIRSLVLYSSMIGYSAPRPHFAIQRSDALWAREAVAHLTMRAHSKKWYRTELQAIPASFGQRGG